MKNNNNIEDFKEDTRLRICNQTFRNKIDLDQYVEWNALPGIIFINYRFQELELLGKVFGPCDFKDCNFNDLSLKILR